LAHLSVGIGEMAASRHSDDIISALGLGSCVALIIFDARTGTVGFAHCMLPTASGGPMDEMGKPARYVDKGVQNLLKAMGVARPRHTPLTSAIVGGAAMFEFNGPGMLDIGKQNVSMAQQMLQSQAIPVLKTEVGGNRGRSVTISVAELTVRVRDMEGQKDLVCFRRASVAGKAA